MEEASFWQQLTVGVRDEVTGVASVGRGILTMDVLTLSSNFFVLASSGWQCGVKLVWC